MTDQEKIAALTKALEGARDAFQMLSEYDPHEMETAQMISAREARRVAEALVYIINN